MILPLVIAAALARPLPSAALGPPVGKAAPNFALESTAGKTLALDDLRGRVVVVNFFATWCPPCRAETPDLVSTEAKYRAHGVVFLGVDDREPADLVRVFTSLKHVEFPIVLDSSGAIEAQYDIRAIPTTYVLDRNGVIRYRNVQQLDGKTLARVIDAVLVGKPPRSTPTQMRFDSIASAAIGIIQADLGRARYDDAIKVGTKASSQLSDIQNGERQAELDYYQSTKTADPLYLALAQAYERRAQMQTTAANVRADLEQAALQYGQTSQDREQFAAAERAYAQAISLQPNDTAAYDGEYLAAYEERNYAEAQEVALAQAQIAPLEPESWLTLASADNQLKNYRGALAAERHALTLAQTYRAKHPFKKHAAYEVGRVWLKMGRTQILAGKPAAANGMLQRSALAAPGTIVAQQADEQRMALEPFHTAIAIAGRDWTTAASQSPAELYIDVLNTASMRRDIQLASANVPPKWVLSFCYAKVCSPNKSTVSIAAGKSLKVQLKVVPLSPTGGPWRMQLTKSSNQKIVVGIGAKTTKAKVEVSST